MTAITLRQLEYFVALTHAETITAAADACHVSQAAISSALSLLEDRLGVDLIIRNSPSTGMSLTPEGRTLAGRAKGILRDMQDLESLATTDSAELAGDFKLGCFTPLSPIVVPPLLEYFTRHHPKMRIQLEEGSPKDLERLLLQGELDTVLAYSRHLSDSVVAHTLAEAALYVVLSSNHPLASRKSIELKELSGQRQILLDLAPINLLIPSLLEQSGLDPEPAFRSKSVETVRSLVARGLGYAIMGIKPREGFSTESRPLTALDVSTPYPRGSMVAAHRRGQRGLTKIQAIIDQCRVILSEDFSDNQDHDEAFDAKSR